MSANEPLSVWRLCDGKPGHESQTHGLIQALAEQRAIRVVDYVCPKSVWWPLWWLLKCVPIAPEAPKPDIVVAAGHRTHWAALTLKRLWRAYTVVLMRPSLPARCFDAVVAPAHDNVHGRRVLVTEGALNPMRPGDKKPGSVLLLLGGPSKHFAWSNERVLAQVHELAATYPNLLVTDSRRTPSEVRQALEARFAERFMPWQSCPLGWLASKLAETEVVWVSQDSVSMIYEALTAGCAVGLIMLQASPQPTRVAQGITALIDQGRVGYLSEALSTSPLPRHTELRESQRIATILWQQFDARSRP